MMRIVTERGIGETRAAVYEAKTLKELHVRRDSQASHPFAGDVFDGRVVTIDKNLDAAFVDIGHGPQGFFRFAISPGAPRVKEGDMMRFEIVRQSEDSKGPILKYSGHTDASKPAKVSGQSLMERLQSRYPGAKTETGQVPDILHAVEPSVALQGGGEITLEQTRALVAIDVDTGIAVSKAKVAIAAAKASARELRLRGMGGLVVIDFPNLRKKRDQEQVHSTLVSAFKHDPDNVKIGPFTMFGTIELVRQKFGPSLMDTLCTKSGELTDETLALDGLRRLAAEGQARPGARLVLTVPSRAYDWLQKTDVDWKAQAEHKLGARFDIVSGDNTHVSADR